MIGKDTSGKWRVRHEYGHNKYYKIVLKEIDKQSKTLKKLQDLKRKKPKEEKKVRERITFLKSEKGRLEFRFEKPVNVKNRRSFNCRNKWQAEEIEVLFREMYNYEIRGEDPPMWLQKEHDTLVDAPYRDDFLEEMGYQFASVSGLNPTVLENFDYPLFLSQADINSHWVEKFRIREKEVRNSAFSICFDEENIPLKGKKYLFTGAFMGFTVCEDFVNCLYKMAEDQEVDGIITSGPWVKYIFLHKTSRTQKILSSVKRLCAKFKVYAIRSNIESAELIPDLKELGIKFVTKIEDENNVFLSHKFSRMSQKDQLSRFRDYAIDKNLFVPTTYVAFESQLRKDNLRYIVGSGSSSFPTPRSRLWANAYDGQRINAEKYDSIGGHILRFDSDGHVYPSNFHYNHKVKAIMVNGKVYPLKGKVTDSAIHLLVSDVHAKLVDKKAFNGLISFIKKHKKKIKSICINGDFLDNVLLCHHDEHNISNQIKNKLEHKSFLHEISQARYLLNMIVDSLGDRKNKVRLVFKLGNHDINSVKKILQKSLTHFLDTMLNLDSLLNLKELGFEVVEGKEPYCIGDITIYHGHEITRPKASRILGKNSVSGHSHKGKVDNLGTVLPTLQDQTKADYLPFYKESWTAGWGVLSEYKNVVERPELVLVNNDKYCNFSKIAKISKPIPNDPNKFLVICYDLS